MKTTQVTLCLVANDAFAVGAEATLCSAVARTSAPIAAYVVDIGLSEVARRRLARLGAEIVWVRLDTAQRRLLASFHTDGRFGHWAAYARVLLGEFLPELERVIYLDTDTVVLADLVELASFELSGHTVGAVDDPWVAGMHVRKVLGRDPGRPLKVPRYFNSGVMLIDRQRWRDEQVGERIVELLRERRPFVYYDQDPLNLLLADDWVELPSQWNRIVPPPDAVPAASSAVARRGGVRRDQLLHDAWIMHFVGSRKPWTPGSTLESEFADMFWRHVSDETRRVSAVARGTRTS